MMLLTIMLLLQVAFLLLAAAFVYKRLKRPELAHTLILLVFVRLIVPPVVETPIIPSWLSQTETPAIERETPIVENDEAKALVELPAANSLDSRHDTPIMQSNTEAGTINWWAWILGLWGGIVGILLLRSAHKSWRFGRVLRSSPATDTRLLQIFDRLCLARKIKKRPILSVVYLPMSPALWPGRTSIIVMPAHLLSILDDDELECVVLHELCHFERRDHLVRIVEHLASVLYWWCPAIPWVRTKLRMIEETCCDRRVLHARPNWRRVYSEALIKSASSETATSQYFPALATGVGARKTLEERITMIMKFEPEAGVKRLAFVPVVLLLLATLPLLPVGAHEDWSTDTDSFSNEKANLKADEKRIIELAKKSHGHQDEREPVISEAEKKIMTQVLQLISAGETIAAQRILENALSVPTASAVFDFTLGNLNMQGDQHAKALTNYTKAVKKHPSYLRAWRNLGLVSYRLGKTAAAASAFRKTIDLGGKKANDWGLLGTSLIQLGQSNEAAKALEKALALDPVSKDWSKGLIQAYIQTGRNESALELIDRILKNDPSNESYLKLRANCLLATRNHEEAIKTFEFLHKRGALKTAQLYTLGDLYLNQNRYSDALGAYRRAIATDRGKESHRAIRAIKALSARGATRQSEALQKYLEESAIQVDETKLRDIEIKSSLRKENVEETKALLEKAIAQNPKDGVSLILYGRLLKKEGRYSEALQFFERAVQVSDVRASAHLHAGQILVSMKRYADAMNHLKISQKLKPQKSLQSYINSIERLIRKLNGK